MKIFLTALIMNIAALFLVQAAAAIDEPLISIIPQPAKMERVSGSFQIAPETLVVADERSSNTARQLIQWLKPAMGFELKLSDEPGSAKSTIRLTEDAKCISLGAEGYQLKVSPDGIQINAASQAGLFYGIQSLRQLLPPQIFAAGPSAEKSWSVPCVLIEDKPRFAWRGFMLDCGHAFQTVSYVKRFLDLMAIHKLNIFHWHLTDNCTWAVEIIGYPQLTSPDARVPAVRAPGFYTQAEIRDVVQYAAERHITIVPEIDVPGHSTSALLALPELRCPVPAKVGPDGKTAPWKSYCVGNEKTYQFLEAVISQVIDLFPGPYVHIGADEVGKLNWEQCPLCQAKMQQEHLVTTRDLQGYFTRRIGKYIESKGRKVVGWQEIMQGEMNPGTIVMSWTDMKAGIEAAKQGHDVVMMPQAAMYFSPGIPAMSATYNLDPSAPEILTPDEAAHILGGEACHWGGLTGRLSESQNDHAAFPRIAALCESLWTPVERRDYDGFISRLQVQLSRYAALGVDLGGCELAPSIGTWEVNRKTKYPKSLEWPITAGIKGAGRYKIKFVHDKGDRLWVQSAQIIQDGKVLVASKALDFKPSEKPNNNPWVFDLPPFAAGQLILRVSACPKFLDARRTYSRGAVLVEPVK